MTDQLITTYLETEGRASLETCMVIALEGCAEFSATKLVVFTGTGAGPHFLATNHLIEPKFASIKVVAVTPPVGREYRTRPGDDTSPIVQAGIPDAMREELLQLGVYTVSAHLPFKETYNGRERVSEWSRVSDAFGIFGGGFALCVQAVLMACDAGHIFPGERVVAASADTAIVVRASRTETFLSPFEGLLVEHILCRPRRLNVSKPYHYLVVDAQPESDGSVETTGQHVLTEGDNKGLPLEPSTDTDPTA